LQLNNVTLVSQERSRVVALLCGLVAVTPSTGSVTPGGGSVAAMTQGVASALNDRNVRVAAIAQWQSDLN
jgi:ammonia channel protein AmtB